MASHVEPGRVERVVFHGCSALVALHLVDDAFVHPQAGTSAHDHAISGLVPIALLALLTAGFARLRPGVRALAAVLVGVMGAVAGASDAVYPTIEVGASGDDYTGLLAVPASLVLVGLGVVGLWRTRRLDERLRRRYGRRTLIAIVASVVVYHGLGVAYAYVFTHAARANVPAAELGAAYEDVTFSTADGLELTGWYVPSRNGAAVIVYAGRSGTQQHARLLARHGYGVLLFDRRGEGQSEGDPDALGWLGDRDIDAAVAYLRRRADVTDGRIGGLGLSTGGEVLLQAAARSDGLRAVVSEGAGIRSIREELELPGGLRWVLLPQWSVSTAATAVFANHAPPPNLKDLIGRIAPRPIFLIFARSGQGGEQQLNPVYYAAAGPPKQLWGIDGSAHTGGITARPAEYERRVVEFLDDALLQEARR